MASFDFIPEAPTSVGSHKQLFVDGHIVAEKVNVSLEVGKAKKTRCRDAAHTSD